MCKKISFLRYISIFFAITLFTTCLCQLSYAQYINIIGKGKGTLFMQKGAEKFRCIAESPVYTEIIVTTDDPLIKLEGTHRFGLKPPGTTITLNAKTCLCCANERGQNWNCQRFNLTTGKCGGRESNRCGNQACLSHEKLCAPTYDFKLQVEVVSFQAEQGKNPSLTIKDCKPI